MKTQALKVGTSVLGYWPLIAIMIALLAVPVPKAVAEDPVIGGYTDGGRPTAGGQIIGCKKDGADVLVTVRGLVLIRDPSVDGPKGNVSQLYTDPTSKAQAFRYFERDDGVVYALALGPTGWKYDGLALDAIDPESTPNGFIAKENVSGGNVTLRLTGAKPNTYYAFNLLHIGSDGTHAWGGIVGSQFSATNIDGKPLLLVKADCSTPSTAALQYMAGQK